MKVVFVITGLGSGGAEAMLYKVLANLDRQAFQPEVVVLSSGGKFVDLIRALGISVHEIDFTVGSKALWNFFRLVRLLRSSRPALVSTWMYHADLLGGIAAKLAGVQTVVWNVRHGDLSPILNKRRTLFFVKLCAASSAVLPSRIMACSRRAMHSHITAGYRADLLEFVPNGFDLDAFFPDQDARTQVRAELDISPDFPLVGMIGRFHPTKNHFGFLAAAKEVRRRVPSVHFLLAGTDVDDSNTELVSAVKGAGLDECVRLLGRRSDVPRLMAALDVLALPSLGEAFPNVVGEAMASGVPCVVTDVGDAAEIVGSTGRVVGAEDMVSFAAQLVEIIQLSAADRRALGESARARVTQHYEIRNIVRQYEGCFMAALDACDDQISCRKFG